MCKKRRLSHNTSTVEEFKRKYIEKEDLKKYKAVLNSIDDMENTNTQPSNDYIEKDEFIKEVQKEVNSSQNGKRDIKPVHFTF